MAPWLLVCELWREWERPGGALVLVAVEALLGALLLFCVAFGALPGGPGSLRVPLLV